MAIMVSITIPVVAEDNATTMDPNFGTIAENPSENTINMNGTMSNHDNAVITANNGTVVQNAGTITQNNGTVTTNYGPGMITNNNGTGTVTTNGGHIDNNFGTVDKNGANLQEANDSVIIKNGGTVTENNGTVGTNLQAGIITTNNGTVEQSMGTVTTNDGTVEKNIMTGVVGANNGTVGQNGGTVNENAANGTITLNGDKNVTANVESMKVETNNGTVTENAALVVTNNGTVATNTASGIVTTNGSNGTVTTNEGTVTTNEGTVTFNEGTVTTNEGTIVENNGVVESSTGAVQSNNGTVTITGTGTLTGNIIVEDAEGNPELKQNVTIEAEGGSQTYHAVTVIDSASEKNVVVQFLNNAVTKLVNYFTRTGYTLLGYAGTEGAQSAEVEADGEVSVTNPTKLFTVWKKDAAPAPTPEADPEPAPAPAPAPAVVEKTEEEKQAMAETAAAKLQEIPVDKLVTAENASAVKYEVAAVVAEGKSEIVITAKAETVTETGVVSLNLEKTMVADLVKAEVEIVRFVVGEQEVSVASAALNQVLAENADAQIVVTVDPVTGNVVVYLMRNGQKIDITDRLNLDLAK